MHGVCRSTLALAGGACVLPRLFHHATVRAAPALRRALPRAAPQPLQTDHCAALVYSRDWFVIDRLRLDKYMVLVRKVLHHLFACLQRHRWCACTQRAAAAAAAHSASRAPPAQGTRHAGLRCPVHRGEGAHGASRPATLAAFALRSLPHPSALPALALTTSHRLRNASARLGCPCTPSTSFCRRSLPPPRLPVPCLPCCVRLLRCWRTLVRPDAAVPAFDVLSSS